MDAAPACPICTMTEVLENGDGFECATCGHEWLSDIADEGLTALDANGKTLRSGDSVTLIKDLKITGKSGKLKVGTKIKGIRIVAGDHEIDCTIEGRGMLVRASFVKLA